MLISANRRRSSGNSAVSASTNISMVSLLAVTLHEIWV